MAPEQQESKPSKQNSEIDIAKQKSGRMKMLLLLAVCIAPVVASYFTYYVIKPTGRTNFGVLLDPSQNPMPQLGTTTLDGKPISLDAYKGKWILLQADAGNCNDDCRDKLLVMRQERAMQGKEMDRIETVWLVTDNEPIDTVLMREYDGTHMLRANSEALAKWLSVAQGGAISDSIYVVDPLGNLIMRFPKSADRPKADADDKIVEAYKEKLRIERANIKKDIYKLLTASSIG